MNYQRLSAFMAIEVIIAGFIIVAALVYYASVGPSLPAASPPPIACTEEAKICPDGSAVGRVPPRCEFAPCPNVNAASNTNAVAAGGCIITGCSGQVCSDKDVVTTCEYQPSYACYRTARCERQAGGKCGWTMTPELEACLIAARGPEPTDSNVNTN